MALIKTLDRVEIAGSFILPQELTAARDRCAAGLIAPEELGQIEDKCVADLVKKEFDAGLRTLTDGEYRRKYWDKDFYKDFSGVGMSMISEGHVFQTNESRTPLIHMSGSIGSDPGHKFLRDFQSFGKLVPDGAVARQSIPAPAQFLFELLNGDRSFLRHYADKWQLADDISNAYRNMLLMFYGLGCRSVQLDDCTWGMLCDRYFQKSLLQGGTDVKKYMELMLRVNNESIAGLPDDMDVITRVRGMGNRKWESAGNYDEVAEMLFSHEEADAFMVDIGMDCTDGLELLRFVPEGKNVILGLVDAIHPQLESRRAVIDRIEQAARYVDMDNLGVSPHCGFGDEYDPSAGFEEIDQWRKIELLRNVASEMWR